MSVYIDERPEFLLESLASLAASKVCPTEVVLVEDGPLREPLREVIDKARVRLNIISVALPRNVGLPGALNEGLKACNNELVARFDTDDLCHPQRFERQLAFMEEHPDVAALGSVIQEFDSVTGAMLGMRAPPTDHVSLVRHARLSSPLNHPSVMFRRSAVLEVGAYPEHMTIAYEDYALWIRLIMANHQLANLPEVLVYMRAGSAQVARRRGIRYARQEILFVNTFRRAGFFNTWQYLRFVILRVPLRFFPKKLVALSYYLFARTDRENNIFDK